MDNVGDCDAIANSLSYFNTIRGANLLEVPGHVVMVGPTVASAAVLDTAYGQRTWPHHTTMVSHHTLV